MTRLNFAVAIMTNDARFGTLAASFVSVLSDTSRESTLVEKY